LATNPKLLILEDPLDHVNQKEKARLIESLVAEENRWQVIVASVDEIWKTYIPRVIEINNGQITSN